MLRYILIRLIDGYELLLILEIILSWIPLGTSEWSRKFRAGLAALTEPFLNIFRGIIPSVMISGVGMDFSPILAFMVLGLLRRFL